MESREFLTFTIGELIPLLQTRQLSPVEVVEACLDRVESYNPTLRAYVSVFSERSIKQAHFAQELLLSSQAPGPLCGVPISLKDVFKTRDARTTWGARNLANYITTEDATVARRLAEAGAILLGKCNVDAYPYYGSPENGLLLGPTRNPWNLGHTAGRSSGGSAAAVAAMFDYGSVGSDAGGSVRIPASFCGVVGLKPTFGLVSKHGVFPYSESFEHCAPLARSVSDCALLLGALAGHDPLDSTTVSWIQRDYTKTLEGPVRGLRVGLPRVIWERNDPEVSALTSEAVRVLQALRLEPVEIELPYLRDSRWVNVVNTLEITAMTRALVEVRQPSDPYVLHLVFREEAGRKRVLAQGRQIAQAAKHAYADLFREIDLIVTPTVPTPAPEFTEDSSQWQEEDEPFRELWSRYTRLFNLIGAPAISVPCGFTKGGMPVGMQIATAPFAEDTLFRVAFAYERETPWHTCHPVLPKDPLRVARVERGLPPPG